MTVWPMNLEPSSQLPGLAGVALLAAVRAREYKVGRACEMDVSCARPIAPGDDDSLAVAP